MQLNNSQTINNRYRGSASDALQRFTPRILHRHPAYLLLWMLCVVCSGCARSTPTPTPIPPSIATPVLLPSPIQTEHLLKSEGPAIYRRMDDGTLRHVPTWADFVALGYEDSPITTVRDADLAMYPLGPPLTANASIMLSPEERNPLNYITGSALDPATETLWLGTAFAGVYRCPWPAAIVPAWDEIPAQLNADACEVHTSFTGDLLDNTIHDLLVTEDGTVWIASKSGLSHYAVEQWQAMPLAEGATAQGALALALAADGMLWVAGDDYIAYGGAYGGNGEVWHVHTAIDQPLLADIFTDVIMDSNGGITFIGSKRKLRFDGTTWRAYGDSDRDFVEFQPDPLPPPDVAPPPLDFPDPRTNYHAWLQQWPRPTDDNGRCMHFVQASWLNVDDAQRHIDQLLQLNARWVVVPYANHFQLRRLAPLFAEAGIMVIWRPFIRPHESYKWWAEDISYLRAWGIPPYMQLYNEPSLVQEWQGPGTATSVTGQVIDQERFLQNLVDAVDEVDRAGGYIGLQSINQGWLRVMMQRLVAEGLASTFQRLFFVPHPYGLNHPPAYAEDESSVLGFLFYEELFKETIGFVPMMIAGEGGWRPGEAQDARYPAVTELLHQEYHVALFEWFRTGKLSNGEDLPDYLFTFCPWLIADPVDPAAWFGDNGHNRPATIAAVMQLEPFVRKFSWE